MMESQGESSELQQLVSSDDAENEEETIGVVGACGSGLTTSDGKALSSPVRSTKISSSGNTSHSSVSRSRNLLTMTNHSNASRLHYVNEKCHGNTNAKDNTNKTTVARPRNNTHKVVPKSTTKGTVTSNVRHHCFLSEVPDVRHMERALLGLLADFHSGKLKAFGSSGSGMKQMTDIREQQEKLAKLHFDLSGSNDPSASFANDTDNCLTRPRGDTMSRLIERLEQLSVSIEGLHNENK